MMKVADKGAMLDLHVYDPANRSWTNISYPASGIPPPARDGYVMASAGGKLYLMGGTTQMLTGVFNGESRYPNTDIIQGGVHQLKRMVFEASSSKHWVRASLSVLNPNGVVFGNDSKNRVFTGIEA
jgi:hypothetical protein